METLDDFRGHPQFNELKRLVQRDPAMLSTVLQMIGQQSPNLLARIHENQQQFIELMNEPVDESAPPAAPAVPGSGTGALGSMTGWVPILAMLNRDALLLPRLIGLVVCLLLRAHDESLGARVMVTFSFYQVRGKCGLPGTNGSHIAEYDSRTASAHGSSNGSFSTTTSSGEYVLRRGLKRECPHAFGGSCVH